MKTYADLLNIIERTADEGCTLEEAERAAALSLSIMNSLSESLKLQDRDRRMRKRGLKAVKSSVRMNEVKSHDKKPTESALQDVVDTSPMVKLEEEGFDDSEIAKEELERQFGITKESHLYFRGVSKGRFE